MHFGKSFSEDSSLSYFCGLLRNATSKRLKAPLCPAVFGDWYKLIEAYLVEAKLSIAFDPWNETPTGNPFCESYTV